MRADRQVLGAIDNFLHQYLLSQKYAWSKDDFEGESLSNLWVSGGTGQNNASSLAVCGAWNISTLDVPSANDWYVLYGKQEFLWNTIGTELYMMGLISSLSGARYGLGCTDPHSDAPLPTYFTVGTTTAGSIFFEYNSAVGPNWLARVIDGSTDWAQDTGIPAVAMTWTDFKIIQTGTNEYKFYINKGTPANPNWQLVATYSAAFVNNAKTSMALMVQTFDTSKKWIVMDIFSYMRPR